MRVYFDDIASFWHYLYDSRHATWGELHVQCYCVLRPVTAVCLRWKAHLSTIHADGGPMTLFINSCHELECPVTLN
jgi:hypothetical protein